MLDTPQSNEITLRCEALLDRVAATPVGENPHALRVALAECDAMEHSIRDPSTICKLRDARHWLRLAYDHTLHGYPPNELRKNLLCALASLGAASRTGS